MAEPSFAEDRSWAAWDATQEDDETSARHSLTRTRVTTTTVAAGAGHGLVERADGSAARRLTVYLPPDLYRRVKLHVAGLECNLSEFVAEMLDRELDRQSG
jgi:hypothetical protein